MKRRKEKEGVGGEREGEREGRQGGGRERGRGGGRIPELEGTEGTDGIEL